MTKITQKTSAHKDPLLHIIKKPIHKNRVKNQNNDEVKLLVIFNGNFEERVITLKLNNESTTLNDVFEQTGIKFDRMKQEIELIEHLDTTLHYIVKISNTVNQESKIVEDKAELDGLMNTASDASLRSSPLRLHNNRRFDRLDSMSSQINHEHMNPFMSLLLEETQKIKPENLPIMHSIVSVITSEKNEWRQGWIIQKLCNSVVDIMK